MPSDDLRPKAESCCAVANCEQHSSNAILDGYNVSFHRWICFRYLCGSLTYANINETTSVDIQMKN